MLNNLSHLEIFWLYLLSGIFIVAVPVYKHFRNRMVENTLERPLFSRRRILKIIGTNLFLCLVASIIYLNLFLAILSNQQSTRLTLILFIFVIILAVYGSGIYVSFITLEEFIPPAIKQAKFFKVPFSAIKFLHGPVSHLLVHAGAIFSLFFLAVIEILLNNGSIINPWPLLILGGLVGLFYASAQIYNQNVFYQIPINLTALAAFLIFISKQPAWLNRSPVGAHFLGMITVFNLAIIIYLIIKKSKKHESL